VSKPIWFRLRSVLDRDADVTSVELSRESAEEMLAEIKHLTAENERLRAALMSLIEQISMADGIAGKIIIRQKSLDKAALLRALYEARAALSGDKQ
jgi:regulator of replication initiation timing